jgi:ankyrin repeat protein
VSVYAQSGWTPLLIACQNGYVEVVKLLLARSDVLVNKAEKVRRKRE